MNIAPSRLKRRKIFNQTLLLIPSQSLMVKPNASAYNHIESDKKGKVLFTDTSNFLFFPLFWKLQFTFAGAESENYSFNG